MQRLPQTSERENAGTTSLGALLRAKLDNAEATATPEPLHGTARRGATVTRSDLVIQLAERFGQLTHRDTEFAVKTILDAMSDALARGHRIEIRGFGSFSINRRPPRVGPQPALGRAGHHLGKAGAALQAGQGAARGRRPARRRVARRRRARPTTARRLGPARPLESARDDAIARLARPRRRLLHAVRVRAEQPARTPACTGSSATNGARRWSSSCSPRSASAARSASSRWCRAGGGIGAWRATHTRRADDRADGRARAASAAERRRRTIRRAMDFDPQWLLWLALASAGGFALGWLASRLDAAPVPARAAGLAEGLLQGPEPAAQRAARQGDRRLHRGGPAGPRHLRAALRARQPVPPPRRVRARGARAPAPARPRRPAQGRARPRPARRWPRTT